MIDAQAMTIQKLIVSVRRGDNPDAEVSWPYDHVPRVGEVFYFGGRNPQVVDEVQYHSTEGGAFRVVVVLK